MTRLLFILILHSILICEARSQTITVDDLMTLSTLPAKNIENYMNRQGFVTTGGSLEFDAAEVTFVQKKPKKKKDAWTALRSMDVYKKDGHYCFAYHTSSIDEFASGKDRLKRGGFYFDWKKDSLGITPLLFQRRTVTILAETGRVDTTTQYSFVLQKKQLPDPGTIQEAEDLLLLDSHEYLVSVFGESNVKRDVYYFSEKEMKKCSILFPNTSRQAIFVWDEEGDLRKISYILISGISPTLSALRYSGYVSLNRWISRNGLYASMSLKDLLQVNGKDFEFYGIDSEFAYMVPPQKTGTIDFKKTGIMLGCLDCSDSKLLEKIKVSASNAVDHNLSLYIFYIMIAPE